MKTPVFESFQKNTCKTTKTMLTYRQQKSDEKDSYLQTSTGIQRHRLRALFEKRRQREHSGADWLNRILQEKE